MPKPKPVKLEPCGVCGKKAGVFGSGTACCDIGCAWVTDDPDGSKWNTLMQDAAAGRKLREWNPESYRGAIRIDFEPKRKGKPKADPQTSGWIDVIRRKGKR